ncbi:adenosylcobinamide-phosphate synthase CbiB [Sphingomonas sp. R86521]|uniref:adenosylcobinamide-phosphate synthase CbiB n=1 Tax=Sphingomonas sp. R86521 TaxID=3093860 RepID=UPI0036D34EAE
MADPVALLALAIDATVGWPPKLYARIGHPVGAFARIIGWCERWNAGSDLKRRILGIVTLVLVAGFGASTAWFAQTALTAWLGPWAWVGIAILAAPGLAQRSLEAHVRPVAAALLVGDIAGARRAVSMIVGRDTATLNEAGIARAGIESLAESFCDGIAAPLFWLMLLGLPGLWAYKAINTADSLIGHREPRWRAFGWASARADDIANWVPARIAGVIVCIAGAKGFGIMWRDARKHASPNAGWTEAAMAGALDLRLAGPVAYDGMTHIKPWLGDGRAAANGHDVMRALAVFRRSCLLLWIIAGGIAWAL